MFERGISVEDVESVLQNGEIIVSYPQDAPHPSCLMLGFVDNRAIHVVVALEEQTRACYVISAYSPEPSLWEPDFKHRRSR